MIYAHAMKDGAMSTSMCSQTKEMKKAAADLEYFKGIEAPSAGGRIYGTARFETQGGGQIAAKHATILAKTAVTSWTTVTDANGAFEFTDLPVGQYSVVMEGRPAGFGNVQLRDVRACAHVDVWAPRPAKRL